MSGSNTVVAYNVVCLCCHNMWQPTPGSRLWWKAKQRDEQGYLDALHVSGKECGCIQEESQPEARYRVIGYNDLCEDFNLPFESLVPAARKYLELERSGGYVAFFVDSSQPQGVRSSVQIRLAQLARGW